MLFPCSKVSLLLLIWALILSMSSYMLDGQLFATRTVSINKCCRTKPSQLCQCYRRVPRREEQECRAGCVPCPFPLSILTVLCNWSQRAVPHALSGFLGDSFDLPDHNHGPELERQLALQATANAGEVG
ncbi:hypothetical protein B0H13DRAFT_150120 [Mycena leptocephala]|nr:hypothetical protein B0H13DRAFT_150120 [Mycena leptocephala]